MILNDLRSKKMSYFIFFLMLALLAIPMIAAAQTGGGAQANQPYYYSDLSGAISKLTFQGIVTSFSNQIPNLMRMVTSIGYVMGMYFIVMGVLKLKQYGEARSMMSQEHSLKGPIIFITIGALLLYLPTTVHVGLSTFWTNPAPYGYQTSDQDQWTEFLNLCFIIIQLVGTIAFIRGLVILTQLSGHAQPGTFARGLTHIIGGIFCINIYQFVQVILFTLGIQS